jgi:hypothetical protein
MDVGDSSRYFNSGVWGYRDGKEMTKNKKVPTAVAGTFSKS